MRWCWRLVRAIRSPTRSHIRISTCCSSVKARNGATRERAVSRTEGAVAMKNFNLDVDGDGIALITWDMPGRSMNVIDAGVTEELSQIVDKVAADAAIKGAVVTSGKEAFCAGADLTILEQ